MAGTKMHWGAVIMSVFAAIWFAAGLHAGGYPLWAAGLGVLITAAIIAAARHRISTTDNGPSTGSVGKIVGWASGAEGVGILVAVNAVTWAGRPDLAAQAVALVVGLHFLPLAYALPVRAYYVTAAALIAAPIASLLVAGEAHRTMAVCLAAAAILWATSAYGLSVSIRRQPA